MFRILLLAMFLLAPTWASAASFQVNPVRLILSAAHATEVLKVTNSSDTPTVIELQIVAWSQQGNGDVYTASRDLLATPPIFTVAPGKEQIVRVGMLKPPDPRIERSYRLFLMEVPPAPRPGFQGVQMALRMSIPVFVEPAVPTQPALQWTARLVSPTALEVDADNTGTAHAKVVRLGITTTDAAAPLVQQSLGYVLPGARHSWTFRLNSPLAAGAPVEISAETEQGTLHAQAVPAQ